jgi:hypothetical protein
MIPHSKLLYIDGFILILKNLISLISRKTDNQPQRIILFCCSEIFSLRCLHASTDQPCPLYRVLYGPLTCNQNMIWPHSCMCHIHAATCCVSKLCVNAGSGVSATPRTAPVPLAKVSTSNCSSCASTQRPTTLRIMLQTILTHLCNIPRLAI